jgi:LPS sulfotransferase NodH
MLGGMALPDRAYLVCATPRSGSTLLCELLGATGTAGRPLEHFAVLRHSGHPRQPREYFEGADDPRVLERLPAPCPPRAEREAEPAEAWWRRILADGRTPNGVWAGKLMWGHVADLVARAQALDGLGGADLDRVLDALLGEVRLVHVTRPDTVAQAVSLWRAVQTQAWRLPDAGGDPPDRAAYVFAGIDHLRRQLEAHDDAWRRWFAASGRDVLAISYDELGADPRGTAQRVLNALGLPADGVPEPGIRRQGDDRSRAWAERYRDESGTRAAR